MILMTSGEKGSRGFFMPKFRAELYCGFMKKKIQEESEGILPFIIDIKLKEVNFATHN